MIQVSSGWTLAFRLFLPTLWISIFGALFIASFTLHQPYIGTYPANNVRLGLFVFICVFCFLFYKTVMQLKRVELNEDSIFITNYFTNVRYPIVDLKKLELSKGILFDYVSIQLLGKGIFGNRMKFLLSKKRMQKYLENNPDFIHYITNIDILKDKIK
jgi:hypothetical protein